MQTKTFLTQINNTLLGNWLPVIAADQHEAAAEALRRAGDVAELLPCTVYVEIAPWTHHDNGAPCAVQSFRIERAS